MHDYIGARATTTLLPLCCVSSGNDPWSSSYMRSLLNAVELWICASIAFLFPNRVPEQSCLAFGLDAHTEICFV
jgi:hypothetical protein